MHHEQDIFRMGGLGKRIPRTFWPFLAGSACLAGVPLTGGFFSKDSILAAAWQKGGALYGGLYLVGLLTALLTSIYTFRLVYLVFAGPERQCHPVPRLMEATLIPLALLGLCGGVLNLPAYLGGGWLGGFLAELTGNGHAEAAPATELILQGLAGALALAGLAIAHYRYGGAHRSKRLAEAEKAPAGLPAFLLAGWRFDDLYRFLFIRPYEALANFFWQRLDEGVIDESLDRLAAFLGRAGEGIGSWTSGRVSAYIISFAAGAALLVAYLAWGMR
jgi:NADH-quinone oxidoreductase subunit L